MRFTQSSRQSRIARRRSPPPARYRSQPESANFMCGINGLFHFDPSHDVDANAVNAMRMAATHRGPDDHGSLVSGNVGLGFNRLSIIDLAGGHQPLPNED